MSEGTKAWPKEAEEQVLPLAGSLRGAATGDPSRKSRSIPVITELKGSKARLPFWPNRDDFFCSLLVFVDVLYSTSLCLSFLLLFTAV